MITLYITYFSFFKTIFLYFAYHSLFPLPNFLLLPPPSPQPTTHPLLSECVPPMDCQQRLSHYFEAGPRQCPLPRV